MVRNAYQGIGTEYETLLGAFDKDNESFKKRIGIDRAASSYKVRVRSRNHLAAFIKITTTQRYAKITTEKIDKDLTMFGNRLNQSFSEISIAM